MVDESIIIAIGPVATVLEDLGVAYYICGSVASSMHGMPRATNDIDAVAALKQEHVEEFVARLKDDYYLAPPAIRKAISRFGSFNLIHHESGYKVDIFITGRRAYDSEAMSRRFYQPFEEEPFEISFWIAAPEDVLLSKLDWFRKGGEVSNNQWHDILGICKIQQPNLDQGYLRSWAGELKVDDLLRLAFLDSGIESKEQE